MDCVNICIAYCADNLFKRLVAQIRDVELHIEDQRPSFPLANAKGLGFNNEYELDFILK